MLRSKLIIGGPLVAVMVVLGAGAAWAKPLSESQFKKQGNAICKDINDQINRVSDTAFAGASQDQPPTDEQISAFVEGFVPIVEQGVSDINDLQEPASVKKDLAKFAKEIKAALTKIQADPTLLSGKTDPFVKADKYAKKVGLTVCANDS